MAKLGELLIKFVTNVILVFLVFAVFFMGYSFFQVNIQKKGYVDYFGYTMFEVATGSMAPSINIDDLVIVKLKDSYSVGDVITYDNKGDYITHRVLNIDEFTKNITAKGDANNTEDANISPNQVVGKVIKTIPKLGVWKKVVMTPKVMILCFVTLILFNFAFSYNKKNKDKKTKVKEKKPFRK